MLLGKNFKLHYKNVQNEQNPSLLIVGNNIVYNDSGSTGKNNRFPFWDILGYLKNTHKNPKFGRVRQVPTRELGWEFPGWDLSHFAKFGIFMDILYIPKNIQKWGSVIFSCGTSCSLITNTIV